MKWPFIFPLGLYQKQLANVQRTPIRMLRRARLGLFRPRSQHTEGRGTAEAFPEAALAVRVAPRVRQLHHATDRRKIHQPNVFGRPTVIVQRALPPLARVLRQRVLPVCIEERVQAGAQDKHVLAPLHMQADCTVFERRVGRRVGALGRRLI